MPIFDIVCIRCGHEEEIICPHSELDAQRCPCCDSKMKRIPSVNAKMNLSWDYRPAPKDSDFR